MATFKRKHPTVIDADKAAVGDVRGSNNLVSSKIEDAVRAAMVEAGYRVRRVSVICRHPDRNDKLLALTPDVALTEHKIAIEVDPCTPPTSRHGFTHYGNEIRDAGRNSLLGEAGWTVIRLRLDATAGMAIGPRDVVVQSSGFTRAARTALVEAIEDAVHDRPPRVRVVEKGRSPAPAQRRNHVVNIGDMPYTDDGHIFTWYPSLENPVKRKLRLCHTGRYLYTHPIDQCGSEKLFISEIGLHQVPRDQWRQRLTEALKGADPGNLGSTLWPWGDQILIADDVHEDTVALIERCEHKSDIDALSFTFTTNGARLDHTDGVALLAHDGTEIARLHPDAVVLGYRIPSLDLHSGRHGDYQSVSISRLPKPA
ncbi:hypothetical protein [Georgenia yuyongxinii]|uniref:Uncharacterized protein n=1 Tax=Georgenia yuyongxinii TaxID=2589797 RepID=A0A552WUC6_9MICO|nr:hypothetical protein [Georgenia yuyongxinii]TRW46374.1 hypothetical protein FJ693_05460 [Georgenia yuyongxinii]